MSTPSRRTRLQATAVSAPSWSTGYLPLIAAQLWLDQRRWASVCWQTSSGRCPGRSAQVGRRMMRFRYDRSSGTAVCHQHKREETRRTWKPGQQDPLSTIWRTAWTMYLSHLYIHCESKNNYVNIIAHDSVKFWVFFQKYLSVGLSKTLAENNSNILNAL